MSDNANNDPIGKALGMTPYESNQNVKNIIADAHNDSASTDFTTARANIHNLIDTSKTAIEQLSEVAKSSQHPRAYEVLANLITTSLNANKALLEHQEKIRKIQEVDNPMNSEAKTQNIENAIFVGSTSDLQQLIKNSNKKNIEIDDNNTEENS